MTASEEMRKLYKAYQSRINYIPGPFAGGGGGRVGRKQSAHQLPSGALLAFSTKAIAKSDDLGPPGQRLNTVLSIQLLLVTPYDHFLLQMSLLVPKPLPELINRA